jgi:hypothetical protein
MKSVRTRDLESEPLLRQVIFRGVLEGDLAIFVILVDKVGNNGTGLAYLF